MKVGWRLSKNSLNTRYLKTAIILICVGMFGAFLHLVLPTDPIDYGAWSFLPAIFLVVYILITKRIIEGLTFATILCFFMADGLGFFEAFSEGLLEVMIDEDTAWLIIVCGLMGSIIQLIEKAGGTLAFGQFVAKRTKTKVGTLLWTWALGLIIFVDDYLNCLTVGSCMAPLTDKHKVSREYLTYVVDSTSAPDCVLIPISTWAVFASKIIAMNTGTTEPPLKFFVKTIPFDFYPWFALIIVLLSILGIFPVIGPMKKAQERVQNGGPLAPEGSEKIDIHGGQGAKVVSNPKIYNFFLPIVVLIASTIICDIDLQKGVLITLAFLFLLYVPQKVVDAEEFADCVLEGFKNMLMPLLLMVLAFLFSYASNRIYFTQSVINCIVPTLKSIPQLLPALVFLVLGLTEFVTGSNWGMYIIALPVVIPLANAVGCRLEIAVAAVLSAGIFGSHICFYSDATILSSSACGCNNYQHSLTQLPYGLVGAGLSVIAFLIVGFTCC